MKKVSMVLLAILFSASMASAESFEVKAFNWGTIANGGKSKVEAYTRTFTDAKDPTFTANRLNKDVSANIINTRVIGADATMLVKVDIDCVDCADKFYDQVDVQADNKGDIFSKTDTFSTVGMVEENTIGNVAIGSNAGGLYTNTRVNAPSNTDPVRDATFNILSTNHGFDNNGDRTIVEATALRATSDNPTFAASNSSSTAIGSTKSCRPNRSGAVGSWIRTFVSRTKIFFCRAHIRPALQQSAIRPSKLSRPTRLR